MYEAVRDWVPCHWNNRCQGEREACPSCLQGTPVSFTCPALSDSQNLRERVPPAGPFGFKMFGRRVEFLLRVPS